MSELAAITRLQKNRLEAVERELRAARSELEREEMKVSQAKARLEAQRERAAREERRIDAELFAAPVTRKKLDDRVVDLQLLRNATLAMETAWLQAVQERDKAKSSCEQVEARYRAQAARHEKYLDMLAREQESEALAACAAEDMALEEAVELMGRRHAE